jgi:predicted DNA-binding transcriptional regulator AlpA
MKKTPDNLDLFENANVKDQCVKSQTAEISTHEDASEAEARTVKHLSKNDLEGTHQSINCIYLKVEEVARRYGVASGTIWRWVKDCSNSFPPPYKLSEGTTRWKLADLLVWEIAFHASPKAANQQGKV